MFCVRHSGVVANRRSPILGQTCATPGWNSSALLVWYTRGRECGVFLSVPGMTRLTMIARGFVPHAIGNAESSRGASRIATNQLGGVNGHESSGPRLTDGSVRKDRMA